MGIDPIKNKFDKSAMSNKDLDLYYENMAFIKKCLDDEGHSNASLEELQKKYADLEI